MAGNPVRAVPLDHLGGDVVALAGASVQAVTLPAICTMFQIRARGGAVYYEINGAVASVDSSGYVADGSGAVEGPLSELSRLDVFGAQGAFAHITFYKQHGFG